MKRIVMPVLLAAVVVVLAVVPVAAQQPPPDQPQQQQRTPPPGPPPDMLDDAMFPPEMIMQHQRELGLTDEQKTFMRVEIGKTAARFNDLQWQLQDAMEALHDTMKTNQVNEQQALTQLDKVLDTEREIKRLHIGLAIRIKNVLTPEQQEKLLSMRHERSPYRHGPGGPGGPPRGPGGSGLGGPGPVGPGPGSPPRDMPF